MGGCVCLLLCTLQEPPGLALLPAHVRICCLPRHWYSSALKNHCQSACSVSCHNYENAFWKCGGGHWWVSTFTPPWLWDICGIQVYEYSPCHTQNFNDDEGINPPQSCQNLRMESFLGENGHVVWPHTMLQFPHSENPARVIASEFVFVHL